VELDGAACVKVLGIRENVVIVVELGKLQDIDMRVTNKFLIMKNVEIVTEREH
jgi:hypothetical protein